MKESIQKNFDLCVDLFLETGDPELAVDFFYSFCRVDGYDWDSKPQIMEILDGR